MLSAMMIKIIGYKKHNNVYYENTIVKYLGIFHLSLHGRSIYLLLILGKDFNVSVFPKEYKTLKYKRNNCIKTQEWLIDYILNFK